jgi:uncharacterized protein with HEPN domain
MKKHEISNEDRLHHIHDAIKFIRLQTAEISEEEFYRAEVLKRAVVRELEVIGEAANGISDDVKLQFPDVPWRQIIATRHRIIHEYFHVSYITVWAIMQNDLPRLDKQIEKIIRERF